MDIKEITRGGRLPKEIIADLKRKSASVPAWSELEKQYEQRLHPVMTDKTYKDKLLPKGRGIEKVTRITLGWQKLAVKRMTELMFGIPVQRIYKPQNENEKKAAEIIEAVLNKNRVGSLNIERGRALFASCECVTIWYSQAQETVYAGEKSALKLRCKNFSPMNGDALYPLFDEYDDMVALSVGYTRREGDKQIEYFDAYTANEHIRWRTEEGKTEEELRERHELEKISGVYIRRKEPVWEDQSENVYEAEWTLSRNGNYIRKNARPNWVVFSDEKVKYGSEAGADNDGRNVLQYGREDKAQYVTWEQAIESIKFHTGELRRNFFSQLQLPEMSMEDMKATPMSGEARNMMFIDCQLKVTDESGMWIEFFDRELNVIRAFMKKMYPKLSKAIEELSIETVITPYQIRDERERINNLVSATAGKPIISQRTAISNLGWVEDIDEELRLIAEESEVDILQEPTV